jgi:hypothetical protein
MGFTVEVTKTAGDIDVRIIRRQQAFHGYTAGFYGTFVLAVCSVDVEIEPNYQAMVSVESDITQEGRLA